jgi:hypothetical protein
VVYAAFQGPVAWRKGWLRQQKYSQVIASFRSVIPSDGMDGTIVECACQEKFVAIQ